MPRGSDFDDFLREDQLLEAAEAVATKRVIAFQIEREMTRRRINKSEMATRMKTSRAAVERLLDPANTSVTLTTLGRAAAALGQELKVDFVARGPGARRKAQEPERTARRPRRAASKRGPARRAVGKTAGARGRR